MARPGYSTCKGCGKEIVWGQDDKGTKVPLDTKPPTWIIVGNHKDGTAKIVRSSGYVSHFATCPKANDFSGKHRNVDDAAGAPPQAALPSRNDDLSDRKDTACD